MNIPVKKIFLAAALSAVIISDAFAKNQFMKYELKPLPYPENALEPYIDAQTVKLHHGKHQAAYVAKLNAALEAAPEFSAPQCLETLVSSLASAPESIRGAIRNNGGGALNHVFYWEGLSPEKTEPSAEFKEALERDFGSVENFKEQMSAAAANHFGSGWAWLVLDKGGKLKIATTPNQDSPLMGADGAKPIFCIDVWEHAYYLKYQNLRAEYIKNIWNLANWAEMSERYKKALGK